MTLNRFTEELFQRCIDGEASPEERERLERHLATHPDDAALYNQMRRQSELISKAIPVPSTAHLQKLRNNAENRPNPRLRLVASVAIFAAGLSLGSVLPVKRGAEPAGLEVFAKQANAAHSLYVSEVLHPVEVAASEKDHLQTWLSNRLGATIIAPRLAETGYTLIGGRLLPAGDQASALFMYENQQGDRLSLLATHGDSSESQAFRFHQSEGYLTVFWQDGPWRYSLVGNQKRKPMGQIARLIHGQMIEV
jgi:anti-sigma factor RsiW